MKPQEIVDVTRQVALMVRLGLPLAEGLKAMGRASPVLARLGHDLEAGDSLAGAVARHPATFSPFYQTMVAAAENLERPEGTLSELSRWLERADALRHRVRAALLHPLLVLNVLLLELALFLWVVFPAALVPLARTTHWLWLAQAQGLCRALGVVAVLALAGLDLLAVGPGARFETRLPWSGGLWQLAEQSLWARALAALLAAGVSLSRAVEQALSVVRGARLGQTLAPLALALDRGASLTVATRGLTELDPILVWAMAAGEEREELSSLLQEVADELEAEVERRATHALRMLEPWALASVGLLVLLALVAFWWPYYSMLVEIP